MLYTNKSDKWIKFKETSLAKKNLKNEIKETIEDIRGRDIVLNNLNTSSTIYHVIFNKFLVEREKQRAHLEELLTELKKQPNLVKVFFSTIKQK